MSLAVLPRKAAEGFAHCLSHWQQLGQGSSLAESTGLGVSFLSLRGSLFSNRVDQILGSHWSPHR